MPVTTRNRGARNTDVPSRAPGSRRAAAAPSRGGSRTRRGTAASSVGRSPGAAAPQRRPRGMAPVLARVNELEAQLEAALAAPAHPSSATVGGGGVTFAQDDALVEAERGTLDLDHLDQTDLGDLQELCRAHSLDVGGNCVALRARLRTHNAAVARAAGSQQDDVMIDEEGPAKKKAKAGADHLIKVGSHVVFKNVTYQVASVFGGADELQVFGLSGGFAGEMYAPAAELTLAGGLQPQGGQLYAQMGLGGAPLVPMGVHGVPGHAAQAGMAAVQVPKLLDQQAPGGGGGAALDGLGGQLPSGPQGQPALFPQQQLQHQHQHQHQQQQQQQRQQQQQQQQQH